MNDLDLKNLLPEKDSRYWEPLIDKILNQTVYTTDSHESVLNQIFNWWKPILVTASLATVFVWTLVLSYPAQTGRADADSFTFNNEINSAADRMIVLAVESDSPSASQLCSLLGDMDQ